MSSSPSTNRSNILSSSHHQRRNPIINNTNNNISGGGIMTSRLPNNSTPPGSTAETSDDSPRLSPSHNNSHPHHQHRFSICDASLSYQTSLKQHVASLYLNELGSDIRIYLSAAVEELGGASSGIVDEDDDDVIQQQQQQPQAHHETTTEPSLPSLSSEAAVTANPQQVSNRRTGDANDDVVEESITISAAPEKEQQQQPQELEHDDLNFVQQNDRQHLQSLDATSVASPLKPSHTATTNTTHHTLTNFKPSSLGSSSKDTSSSDVFTTSATQTPPISLANLPSFPAHKLILSRSPVFKALFFTSKLSEMQSPIQYITIPDISEVAFREFLRYIYTEEIELTGRIVLEILYASSKYQLTELEQKCSEFLEHTIDVTNVLFLHTQARTFNNKSLEIKCINFICRHGDEVLLHESFHDLSREEAKYFLDLDFIFMTELQRFHAALNWARAKCMEKRRRAKKDSLGEENSEITSAEEGATSTSSALTSADSGDSEPTVEQLRKQLGDLLYAIRFTQMESKDFALHVVPTKVLTNEETISIFSYVSLQGKVELEKFCVAPRKRLIRRVLVLGADQPSHIEDVSHHIKEAHSDDSWYQCGSKLEVKFHNARDSSPTIDVLKTFDSVLVFSNYSFHSPSILGDRLADYVDNGGGVVCTTFSCVRKYGLGGRFLSDGYMGVSLGENTTLTRNEPLQRVLDNHPVLYDVNDFDPGLYRGEVEAHEDSRVVARWHDGVPLVVEHGNVLTLNFFPVSARLNPKYWTGMDGGKVLLNALIYCTKKQFMC